MNTLSSWEVQTVEMIRLIEQDILEAQSQVAYLVAARESLEGALRIYRSRIGHQYTQAVEAMNHQDFAGKSLREILHLIAERNEKIIVAKDAIKLLKQASVFGNPLHADSMVYTILGRSPEFIKIGRGIYRMNGAQGEPKRTARKERIPGLKRETLELKTVNPDMTKQDVRDTLIKRGFNFQGKSPSRCVHILWVNLGYAKKDREGKQQSLPGVR